MRKTIAIALVLATGLLVVAGARQAAAPPASDVPKLSDDDRRAFSILQVRATGLQFAIGTLQKEMDATNAEVTRLLTRLQQAHPELDLSAGPDGGLTYVRKAPAKK